MSTTVFVYKRAGEDTEYDLNIDSAAAGTDWQHLEAAAAPKEPGSGLLQQAGQLGRDHFGPASCTISTVNS